MSGGKSYLFGPYRLQTPGALLYRHGEFVPLPPKVAQTLQLLVERAGEVVEKEELLKEVWKDAFVEEGSLARTISVLRKTLGGAVEDQEYVATLSKRGYRFVAPVQEAEKPKDSGGERKLMLAILPFENLSGDPEQEYFSDGLTEEMITRVSQVNPARLGVIARTSAMMFKGTKKRIAEIGKELGAVYILEGSVRRSGTRLRISAQLIRVSDETHAWAETYERNLQDILALQAEVARAIAREIQIKLTLRAERRLESTRRIDPQVFELYLKGRYLWNKRTEEGMRKSIDCFQQALKHDPAYAPAYDGIADAYTMLACRGIMPATGAFHKAKTAARQALQIEEDLGEAYASLAHVRLHDWDWVGLEDDFKRALELTPGHAIAWYWYAEYLMAMGRLDESIAVAGNALQMDPVNPLLSASLGMIQYLARRYDDSIAGLQRALEVDPSHFLLHFRLGLVYLQKGMNLALEEMRRAVELSGRSTEALVGLAQAHGAAGDEAAMRKIMNELIQNSRERYFSPYDAARAYASLGDAERAFYWLEKAYDEHNPDLIELKAEPSFDCLHGDARFSDLLRRIGF